MNCDKKTHIAVLTLYGISLLAIPTPSWALLPTTSASPTLDVDCDQYCEKFDKYGFYDVDNNWKTEGNQLCADLGAPVTTAFQSPQPTVSSMPLSCSGTDGVTVTDAVYNILNKKTNQTDFDIPTESRCTSLGEMKEVCGMHNSSVEKYCRAYNAISGGGANGVMTYQGVMLGLDGAAMGTCWLACGFPNIATMSACALVGGVASATELGMQISMRSSSMNQYIAQSNAAIDGLQIGSMAAAGLGGAASIATAGTGIAAKTGALDKAGLDKIGMDKMKAQRAAACSTAVVYTALFALRAANLGLTADAKKNLCTSITSHFSDGTSTSTTSGTSGNGGSGNATPTSSGGGISSGGSGGDTGALGLSGNSMDEKMACLANGNSLSGCGVSGGQASQGAVDSGSFQNSGNLAPLAGMIPNPSALAHKAIRDGAGAAAASILPGQLGGDLGNSIVGMAQAAQDDAAKLSGLLGVNPPPSAYTGGGGGGGSGGGSGSNPFGGLFGATGGGMGGKGMQGSDVASFGDTKKSTDIWHSSTKESLFQIISGKMSQITERLK